VADPINGLVVDWANPEAPFELETTFVNEINILTGGDYYYADDIMGDGGLHLKTNASGTLTGFEIILSDGRYVKYDNGKYEVLDSTPYV
jgi:hypothetical protein